MKKNVIGFVCFGEVNTPIEKLREKHDEALAKLQAAIIEQTGYRAEQFALIHPGGAVGERLNNKAL